MNNRPDFMNNWMYYYRSFARNSSYYWEKIEPCQVDSISPIYEPFCDVNEQLDPDLIDIFGTARPPANRYLLHSAPGWNSNLNQIPILLIHGAGLDATSYTNLWGMGNQGLQQQLAGLGYRVFALTFSHSHGDNYIQAEQLADAVYRIKELCRVEQVDLVAHSKGGAAARIYLSNLGKTEYRSDVRRYIMLGTPNLGTDYAFRYPSLTYMVYLAGGNGVISWDKLSWLGDFIDISPRSIYYDGCFPGQSQILHRWDYDYPLDVTQQDWWTTYYGGTGYFGHSRGIEQALLDGGDLIKKLEIKGLDSELQFSVLAGDISIPGPIPSLNPSNDGILFVDSVLNTESMSRNGARLLEKSVLPLTHVELLYDNRVARWIDRQLNR